MGDRGNIELKYQKGAIYLYSHWGGSELGDVLKNALIRGKERWDDSQYLGRIIFSEMIKDDVMGLTGYGLSPSIGDGYVAYNVDLEMQEVNEQSFEEFIT